MKWAWRVSFSLVNYNTRKWEVNVNFSVLKIIHIVKPHFVKEGREEGFPTATSGSLPCSLMISTQKNPFPSYDLAFADGHEDAISCTKMRKLKNSCCGIILLYAVNMQYSHWLIIKLIDL